MTKEAQIENLSPEDIAEEFSKEFAEYLDKTIRLQLRSVGVYDDPSSKVSLNQILVNNKLALTIRTTRNKQEALLILRDGKNDFNAKSILVVRWGFNTTYGMEHSNGQIMFWLEELAQKHSELIRLYQNLNYCNERIIEAEHSSDRKKARKQLKKDGIFNYRSNLSGEINRLQKELRQLRRERI